MAQTIKFLHSADQSYGFPPEAFDPNFLPELDHEFVNPEDIEAFAQALAFSDPQATDELSSPTITSPSSPRSLSSIQLTQRPNQNHEVGNTTAQAVAAQAAAVDAGLAGATALPFPNTQAGGLFISAKNDWAPINQKVAKPGRRRARVSSVSRLLGQRSKDETREGFLYGWLKWPLLFGVLAILLVEWIAYLATRAYVYIYEQFFTWRGHRERLRRNLHAATNYKDWITAAKELDSYLGRQKWKEENAFAYYNHRTVRRVWDQARKARVQAERDDAQGSPNGDEEHGKRAVDDLKTLMEACVKNDFVGVENPRLYSQTYYGTKNLVQNFVDETEKSVAFLLQTPQLGMDEKRVLFKRLHANYGRTALCLSGGATFAYYHFGVAKALLDADLLPDVITGTSGGALVAALIATRTNDELKELLKPALASRITACREPISVWFPRWWATGARFDSVDWAQRCSWWTRGSLTFREAYERTGRILNVTCVPSDPHSPTILCNYLTSPDCVIWSAVLASAAVPGILNPVVLINKRADGRLVPYSFGHKWKDGSLRTDIPIKALNLHFNVNFTIVSQANPHINLFLYSSRGSVGRPVTHRKGRGWRGGYLMSTFEKFLKLDMTKWLRLIRHAELLPRPLDQDWSQLWLQDFGGTITIWPKSVVSDYWNILSDPDPKRLARMLHEGQQSAFPKLKFIANRLRIERLLEQGRRETRPWLRRGSIETILSEDDIRKLLAGDSGSTDLDEGDWSSRAEDGKAVEDETLLDDEDEGKEE